jgi:CheY-like chemotaxis protein
MTDTAPLVLVVEDELLIREIAAAAITDAGFEVVEAATAQEALDILGQRPDVGVLFTDVNMPGSLDGLALARLVHEQWPDIKLVVTSGRPLAAATPDDGQFLAKPYTLDVLTKAVREATALAD